MKNMMLGWFQFQHGDGTTDSWTLDDVNITLSLDSTSGSSEGTTTDTTTTTSSSSSSTWIFGVIAGVVIVVIVAIIVIAVVIVKMRSRNDEYEFNSPTKSVMHTEFQNPLYGPMEETEESLSTSVNKENSTDDLY